MGRLSKRIRGAAGATHKSSSFLNPGSCPPLQLALKHCCRLALDDLHRAPQSGFCRMYMIPKSANKHVATGSGLAGMTGRASIAATVAFGRTLACASASMTAEKALNACVCVCVCERVCHSMCDPQDCGLGARAKPGQLPALSPKQNTCLLSKFIKASWVCPQRGQTGRLPPGRASSRGRVTRVGRGALGCRPPPRAPRSRPKAAPHAPRPRAPRA